MMLTLFPFLGVSAVLQNSQVLIRRLRSAFRSLIVVGLAVTFVLMVLSVSWPLKAGLLKLHNSSISLDAPVLLWRFGGYVTADNCGPILHYGFSGPGLSTTGDGLVLDLWCSQAVLRESDKEPLMYW